MREGRKYCILHCMPERWEYVFMCLEIKMCIEWPVGADSTVQ